MSKTNYAWELLNKFKMTTCKFAPTSMEISWKLNIDKDAKQIDSTLYKRLVGSLIYLTTIRPIILYATGVVSWFMTTPNISLESS